MLAFTKSCKNCRYSLFRESVLDVVCTYYKKIGISKYAVGLPKERVCRFWELK